MNGEILTNKQKYRELCKAEPSIPLFSRDWWLDAVCGDAHWDVALVEKGNTIIASMPYCWRKRFCYTFLFMPALTQTLGPWVRPSKARYAKQLSRQKKIMTQLIEQLPDHDSFRQNFHYSITNWQPFYWSGFSQTTYYTYILDNLSDKEKLWDGLSSNIKREIKKAVSRFDLFICSDFSVDIFLDINQKTFERQSMSLPYSKSLVKSIYDICSKQNACKMFFAVDSKDRIHAASFIVWDENSAYYLMGGVDPVLRNSGAMSLVMWESILFAAGVTKKFDFEGSMIESVERFFRAFGALQKPYFCVTKTHSRLLQTYKGVRTLIRLQ